MMEEEWYELILWSGSVFTFLVQLYIFYLINFECIKEMKEYAFFLKLLTGYEILFNLSFGVFLAPTPIFVKYGFETHGLAKYFGLDFCMFCTAFTFYAGAMIVCSQLYCLMYRYLVFGTYKSLQRRFSSIHCMIGMQLVFQFLVIGLSVSFHNIFHTKEELPKIIEVFRHTSRPLSLDRFPVLIKTPFESETVIFLNLVVSGFCLAQTASFALLYLTLKRLRTDVGSMTKNTCRLYWQFAILLGAQMLTPLIFIFIPVICSVLIFFTIISPSPVQVELGYLGLLFYGLTNSALTVLFITPFRRHAAKTFVYWWLNPLLKCLKLDNLIPDQRKATITRVVPVSNLNNELVASRGNIPSQFPK